MFFVFVEGTSEHTAMSRIGLLLLAPFVLVGTAAAPAEVTFTLPIPEDGTYQISLLYPSGKDRASNVPLTIVHADGKAEMKWDMKKGSRHGFATGVGKFRFKAGGTNTVTLSTRGTDGNVIADGVAFVKVAE
jgi:hypothetical protein